MGKLKKLNLCSHNFGTSAEYTQIVNFMSLTGFSDWKSLCDWDTQLQYNDDWQTTYIAGWLNEEVERKL